MALTATDKSRSDRRSAAAGRVVVLDDIAPEGLALLRAADDIQFESITRLSGRALQETLMEFDGAICRSGVNITAEALQGNPRLRAIVRAGVGTDNIDKAAATRQGIVVMNTPGGNTVSTAEHTFALMLALSRNIAPAHMSLVGGKWDRKQFQGSQLAGKTLGIVGLGRIGREVARRAKAFEMIVLGYDPYLHADAAEQLGIERAESITQMLPLVDYLSVHTPLTEETRGLIGTAEIARLKRGARLINCARGGVYDEAALAEGLRSGHLGGVALDVYASEPCTDSPLFGMEKVLVTPHLGASTDEAQTQVAVEAVQLMLKYLQTGEIRHAVNVTSVDPQTLKTLGGFLNVSYRLGMLLAQWHGGAVDRCELNYQGQIAGEPTNLLSAAFCAGLLRHAMDAELNLVNAPIACQERGVELVEIASREMEAFSSSVTATVSGDNRSRTAAATVFGKTMPRLIRMADFRMEAYLDGHLLVITHRDVPGIIGSIGQILAQADVNIAQMTVGRQGGAPGGSAIGVLHLDSAVPAESLAHISQHPDIQSADLLSLPGTDELPAWLAG